MAATNKFQKNGVIINFALHEVLQPVFTYTKIFGFMPVSSHNLSSGYLVTRSLLSISYSYILAVFLSKYNFFIRLLYCFSTENK